MDLHSSLRQIKGIGEKTEQLFQKLGVYTVGDILLHFPRTYQEYPELCIIDDTLVGQNIAFFGRLHTPAVTRRGKRMDVTIAKVFQDDCAVECVWFRMPYIAKQLPVNDGIIFYGCLLKDGNQYKMEQPAIYPPPQYQALRRTLQPIYTLTKGLSQQMVRKTVQAVFASTADAGSEILPAQIVEREAFPTSWEALRMVHFPADFEELSLGRRRLVYEEFFSFILHSRLQQTQYVAEENPWSFREDLVVERAIQALPYTLTDGQAQTLSAIRADLRGDYVSQRLIQGDVGSGKTIVAFLVMLDAVSNGYQAALMAPTEVLARQHEASFRQLCDNLALPYPVICLTGSMTAAQKREAYQQIATTERAFIIGTHALIQEGLAYHQLAVVVTDEQHRFGVKQREIFSQKGSSPHILVMSATPIPRTLAMILYGNMQISAIHELPAERIPIKTCVIKEIMRSKAYAMIAKEIQNGHQAYIICPLVEASEQTEAENVTDYTNRLQRMFGSGVSIASLHGRMAAKEKNHIMEQFVQGTISILVSTTVVEVGVNVPNATVIMIENANRFGLAQLHQLRGRVGRGKWQSYCILMDQGKEAKTTKRLEVMKQSNDGFYIAQEDLKLRGPGDFFGIRQSGDLGFRLADIIGDADLLQLAAQDVEELLRVDSALEQHPAMTEDLFATVSDNRMVL